MDTQATEHPVEWTGRQFEDFLKRKWCKSVMCFSSGNVEVIFAELLTLGSSFGFCWTSLSSYAAVPK